MMTPAAIADWADSQLGMYTPAQTTHHADYSHYGYQRSVALPPHHHDYNEQVYSVAPSLPYPAYRLAPPSHHGPSPSSSSQPPHPSQFAQYTHAPAPQSRTPPPYPDAHHWPHHQQQAQPDGHWSSPADSAYDSSSYSSPQLPVLQFAEDEEVVPEEEQRKKRPRKRRVAPGPDDRLEINLELTRQHTGGHKLLWYFTLELLVDPSQRAVVVWTGQRREFKIVDVEALRRLWGAHNNRPDVKWATMERIFRGLADTVLMAVPSIAHRGRNVPGLYAYITEVSFHLGWSRAQLDAYIEQYADPSYASLSLDWTAPAKRRRLVSTTSTTTTSSDETSSPLSLYPPYLDVQYPTTTTTTVAQTYQEPPHFPAPGQFV